MAIYAIGLPAALLYDRHSQYKPIFVAAMILDVLLLITFLCWALFRRKKQNVARNIVSTCSHD